MKKLFAFILLATVVISFSGCTKNEVVVPNTTIIVDVAPSDWTYSSSSQTYYVQFDMPEIDSYTNDNYAIVVSASFGGDLYEAFPEVYNGYSYSFTHQVGTLTIEVQGADGSTVGPPTTSMRAKIVIIPSNP